MNSSPWWIVCALHVSNCIHQVFQEKKNHTDHIEDVTTLCPTVFPMSSAAGTVSVPWALVIFLRLSTINCRNKICIFKTGHKTLLQESQCELVQGSRTVEAQHRY
uniref:Uncharacterized protein n=1 Tax=Sphaeramia orbicularis TaxID=375764 RepID=A0A673CLN5_9TELE